MADRLLQTGMFGAFLKEATDVAQCTSLGSSCQILEHQRQNYGQNVLLSLTLKTDEWNGGIVMY